MITLNAFQRQWDMIKAEAGEAFNRCGASGWYVLGKEVEAFEENLAKYLEVHSVSGVANGLDAIELGLRALGVSENQKVLTTPLTAFATTIAILKVGAIPVYVDVDKTGSIDLSKVESALKSDPTIKAFVPVHLYGHTLDLDWLEKIRKTYDLLIVEDCAQSIGSKFNGRVSGTVGQCAATSFYPTKNLGAMGDGGALFTNHKEVDQIVRKMRDYGQSEKYVHSLYGLNSRLDELQAAYLRSAVLPRLSKWTSRRVEVARSYKDGIKNKNLEIIVPQKGAESVWHLFPLLVTNGNRDSFQKHLSASGVQSAIHYPSLTIDQPYLKENGRFEVKDDLKTARTFASQELSIPIHPFLTNEETAKVIAACNEWAG